MTDRPNYNLEYLQNVLEQCGAAPSNWPLGEQEMLLELIECEPQAKQLFNEARAFEQVLDLSSAPADAQEADMQGLQSRILMDYSAIHIKEALQDTGSNSAGKSASGESNIIDFNSAGKKRLSSLLRPAGFLEGWAMAGALAACFAFGIYLGGIGVGDWRLDPTASLASLSNSEEQMAELGDFIPGPDLEEDLL